MITKTIKASEADIAKLSKKFKNLKMTLKILNAETNQTVTLADNAKNKLDNYLLVYDPKGKNKSNYSDDYYCRTMEDLLAMMNWILRNKNIYITKMYDDVLDRDWYSLDDIDLEDYVNCVLTLE